MDIAGTANPAIKARCLSRWPFKTASPTVLLAALLEGVGKINLYSPSSTSCDGEVSLELGPASPVPAACDSRVSSEAAFSRALTAWACVVCASVQSSFAHPFPPSRQRWGVAYRYREPPLASRCRFRLPLPPAPVASRSAAVDNPHFVPKTRPRPRPLFCDLRHLVHTCAYPH